MLFDVGAFIGHGINLLLLAQGGADQGAPAGSKIEPLTVCFYAGLALLIVCIALLISPLRDKLAGNQRIALGALNLEVSVVTLLVLVSVGLIAVGFWFRLQGIGNSKEEVARAQEEAKQWRDAFEKEKRISYVAFATLSGVDDAAKMLPDLKCQYVTSSDEIRDDAHIAPADSPKRLKITINDIPKDTSVKKVVLTNLKTHEQWETDGDFDLSRPRIRLGKPDSGNGIG